MTSFVPAQKNRAQVWVAAWVLLVVALVIPQLAWADLASDHPDSQVGNLSSISSSAAYAALVGKYKAGELVFHAPGRRDDRPSSDSANSEQIDTDFLAANPEIVAYRRYVSVQQEVAAAASSARWVALGSYYTARNAAFVAANPEVMAYRRYVASDQTDAAFLAANPEVMAYRRYVASGQTDAAFLAANPEVMTYRRFVLDGCSEAGQVC